MEPISLLELNQHIKNTLSRTLDPSYWVVAEIGEIRVTQKGHCYLELVQKEHEGLVAKFRATIWSYTYRNLNGWFEAITGSPLKQGMSILANIQVSYHELYGLNLNIRDIDPKYTLGERERKKQETIAQLQSDGIFDFNKSLQLPQVPQRIAVVSSPTAAGYGDFMDQLEKSPYQFETTLFKATLQGEQAATSVTQALLEAHQYSFDLVVIVRGGGAQIDLDTFDDYELCSHIAQYPIPVVAGIGHERDHTIADMVAHTSLKTPTAVAEFLITALKSFDDLIAGISYQIAQNAYQRLQEAQYELQGIKQSLSFSARHEISKRSADLKSMNQQLHSSVRHTLKFSRQRLLSNKEQLPNGIHQLIDRHQSKLHLISQSIRLSDPQLILDKGFSITLANGRLIQKEGALKPGQELITITNKSRIVSSFAKEIKRDGQEKNADLQ